MADKITNFEDYVKKEVRHEHIKKLPPESEQEDIPVSQKTMEIEIEDPFLFLNAEERDEYLRQRQLEMAKNQVSEPDGEYSQRHEQELRAKHVPVSEPDEEPERRSRSEQELRAKHVPVSEPDEEPEHRSSSEQELRAKHVPVPEPYEEPGRRSGPGHKPEPKHIPRPEPEAEQKRISKPEFEAEAEYKPVNRSSVQSSEYIQGKLKERLPEEDYDDDDDEFEEEYGEEYFSEKAEHEKHIDKKKNKTKEKRADHKKLIQEREKDREPLEKKTNPRRPAAVKADVKKENIRKTESKKQKKNDAEDEGVINMDLVVRVASILTGIVILIFIAGLVKVKIIDRFMAPDPDEVQIEVSAIPEGYTETSDTVVVTAQALNLRSVPSTQSDETIVEQVSKGTQMERLAISDDGEWALLKWNGQQVYGYMKYMEVSQ